MATYVLVHGAGHGGWCYQRVARILRAEGHLVHTPTLTGLGERAHLLSGEVDLDLHIADVVAVLEYEDLGDVILAGHSYGGMVVTGVADRVPERIAHLVYLDAAMPIADGEAEVDVLPASMERIHAGARVVDGVELVLWLDPDDPTPHGLTDPDDIAWVRALARPHPWKCFAQPLRLANETALWAIPQTVVLCTSSGLVLDPVRTQRARDAGRMWEVDTVHDLMITEPQITADILMRLAP